jgi:hypothetical protein
VKLKALPFIFQLFIFPASLSAQNNADKTLSVGYGIGNYWAYLFYDEFRQKDVTNYRYQFVGPIYLKYESPAKKDKNYTVGFNIALEEGTAHFTHHDFIEDVTDNGYPFYHWQYNDVKARLFAWSILYRFNYYFTKHKHTYFGLGLGIKGMNSYLYSSGPDDVQIYGAPLGEENINIWNLNNSDSKPRNSVGLGMDITFGEKIKITDQWGAWLEWGIAKSVLQAGIYYKIKSPSKD